MADRLTLHAYGWKPVAADLARAGLGLAFCLLPLAVRDMGSTTTLPLLAAAALFAVYGAVAVIRRRTRLAVTDDAIEARALRPVRLDWRELGDLSLAYYSTRRTREKGWMELRLKGSNGATIRCDSSIDGFEAILRRAVAAARANRLPFDRATAGNLQALGLAPPEAAA